MDTSRIIEIKERRGVRSPRRPQLECPESLCMGFPFAF